MPFRPPRRVAGEPDPNDAHRVSFAEPEVASATVVAELARLEALTGPARLLQTETGFEVRGERFRTFGDTAREALDQVEQPVWSIDSDRLHRDELIELFGCSDCGLTDEVTVAGRTVDFSERALAHAEFVLDVKVAKRRSDQPTHFWVYMSEVDEDEWWGVRVPDGVRVGPATDSSDLLRSDLLSPIRKAAYVSIDQGWYTADELAPYIEVAAGTHIELNGDRWIALDGELLHPNDANDWETVDEETWGDPEDEYASGYTRHERIGDYESVLTHDGERTILGFSDSSTYKFSDFIPSESDLADASDC